MFGLFRGEDVVDDVVEEFAERLGFDFVGERLAALARLFDELFRLREDVEIVVDAAKDDGAVGVGHAIFEHRQQRFTTRAFGGVEGQRQQQRRPSWMAS